MTSSGSLVTDSSSMAGSRDCTTTAEDAGWVTCAQSNPANSVTGSNKYKVSGTGEQIFRLF